jgi:hypothetical protein
MNAFKDPHLSLVRPVTPLTPEGCQAYLELGSELAAPAAVPILRPRGLLRPASAARRALAHPIGLLRRAVKRGAGHRADEGYV